MPPEKLYYVETEGVTYRNRGRDALYTQEGHARGKITRLQRYNNQGRRMRVLVCTPVWEPLDKPKEEDKPKAKEEVKKKEKTPIDQLPDWYFDG